MRMVGRVSLLAIDRSPLRAAIFVGRKKAQNQIGEGRDLRDPNFKHHPLVAPTYRVDLPWRNYSAAPKHSDGGSEDGSNAKTEVPLAGRSWTCPAKL